MNLNNWKILERGNVMKYELPYYKLFKQPERSLEEEWGYPVYRN